MGVGEEPGQGKDLGATAPQPLYGSLGQCQARYSTGEFKGWRCIETAKEERHGVAVCKVHGKVFDRFLGHGIDYTRSIVRLEWEVELLSPHTDDCGAVISEEESA